MNEAGLTKTGLPTWGSPVARLPISQTMEEAGSPATHQAAQLDAGPASPSYHCFQARGFHPGGIWIPATREPVEIWATFLG
jgi:hypothetical protein